VEYDGSRLARRHVSRRDVLKALGAGAAALSAGPLLGAAGPSSVAQIAKYIGPIDPKYAGKGMTFDVGTLFAMTGPGAYYGRITLNAVQLAAQHIEALGGPKFNFVVKDIKSGDPQAGVQAVRELGFAKIPMLLSGYVADLGAALPGIEQYKIFSIDGGGGTSLFAMSKPYFWGARAITPDDTYPGVTRYLHEKLPNVKRIAFTGWDLGPLNQIFIDDLKKSLDAIGVAMVPGIESVKIGATDYSASIQKIKSSNPDMVFLSVYGNDVGNFMKQYATSGVGKPVLTFEYTPPSAELAGPAYEGLYIAFDYFDVDHPTNGWGKIFVDEWKAANGPGDPVFYAPNYYEDTFLLWEVIRRVLKAGGDPKDSADLEKAFLTKPSFPSLYGGDAEHAGALAFNLKTHSVERRPMTLSVYRNKKVLPLAYFDIGGADYHLA
jgi:branched-chain amino acid transport system substrate-binding protein